MSVKGLTREERDELLHKKRIRAFYIISAIQLLLIGANAVLAALKLGMLSFITLLVFFVLFIGFTKGLNAISEEGHEEAKKLKAIRLVLLALYVISFIVAFFST